MNLEEIKFDLEDQGVLDEDQQKWLISECERLSEENESLHKDGMMIYAMMSKEDAKKIAEENKRLREENERLKEDSRILTIGLKAAKGKALTWGEHAVLGNVPEI